MISGHTVCRAGSTQPTTATSSQETAVEGGGGGGVNDLANTDYYFFGMPVIKEQTRNKIYLVIPRVVQNQRNQQKHRAPKRFLLSEVVLMTSRMSNI